jgi:hypothetical protein
MTTKPSRTGLAPSDRGSAQVPTRIRDGTCQLCVPRGRSPAGAPVASDPDRMDRAEFEPFRGKSAPEPAIFHVRRAASVSGGKSGRPVQAFHVLQVDGVAEQAVGRVTGAPDTASGNRLLRYPQPPFPGAPPPEVNRSRGPPPPFPSRSSNPGAGTEDRRALLQPSVEEIYILADKLPHWSGSQ